MILFSAYWSIMLYLFTKFCEKISKGFASYYADNISIVKFAKGHNYFKM